MNMQQVLTVFKETLLEIVNVRCISLSELLGSHICQTPRNLNHFYANYACHLCIISALLKCVFKEKKKKLHSSGFQYILYTFFQHPQSNLQLIIPVTSLHGKVFYSFS